MALGLGGGGAEAGAVSVVIDVDDLGVWVAIECDFRGCYRHVSGRPVADADWSAGQLLDAVVGWAMDDGWRLTGRPWCPDHALLGRTDGRVGEGYQWVRVQPRGGTRRYGPS